MEDSIRANRRRVLTSQLVYATLVGGATLLIGFWLLAVLRHGQTWTPADSVIILIAVCLDGLFFYFAFSLGIGLVRWLTRATPVYAHGFPAIRDAVEDMALASGLPAPELLFIDSDFRNAFSMRQGQSATIFFSHGLVNNLEGSELRSVIAHEMAHIGSGDADLNAALASLRGFGVGDRQLRARVNTESTWGEIAWAFLPRLLALGLGALVIASGVLAFISIHQDRAVADWITACLVIGVLIALNFGSAAMAGRILGKFADPAREYLADEIALRWTMDADSLAEALRAAEEDSRNSRLRILFNMGFARFEAEDPIPNAEQRIRALEGVLRLPVGPVNQA